MLHLRHAFAVAAATLVLVRATLGAQGHGDHAARTHDGLRLSADVTALAVRAAHAPEGRTLAEGYLAQPVVMGHAPLLGGRLRLTGTLNLEGLTLRRGQLTPGIYGEGFVDRRHPHTFVHEAMLSAGARPRGGPLRLSAAAGKGFVPFGTDDPMLRPFAFFPVNHHLAQLLERYVAIGGARVPGLMVEGARFGGDEPQGPWAWPRASRFGEGWSARATAFPLELARGAAGAGALELSASRAEVPSPEDPTGAGLDQRKSSLAARWASGGDAAPVTESRRGGYALLEWARTDERRGARRAFRYQSVLAEAALWRPVGAGPLGGTLSVAARAERTGRPEEERMLDPFRTVRPHFEQNVLGITEWRILTVAAALRPPAGRLRVAPFVEAARARPRALVRPSVFEPSLFYRAPVQWTVAAGVRFGVGRPHARMGRYGVASDHR
ncbi:hypothetical protein [Roseisolibacter sp. H3M3-2]|uniref:hypothetical protein n=1 Tax=Roseisolibacter sp. H3M3-2 TaxID=3031323 RepID=UPI0023DCD717|nr:hypothetical protein [Roseisolibacter sp. H3M3-2]MDF1503162.1 hypothetical protein [Roseisolibacter sp. H3M3-2]